MFSWLKNFRIEQLSFWLGFLAALLSTWLYKKLKSYLPQIKALKEQGAEMTRQHKLTANEIHYSLNTLEIAQGKHLGCAFFPLNTIAIPTQLLPPPFEFEPENILIESLASACVSSQVVPFLPDWPELAAQYPVPTLSPAQALQHGARIVIIGNPGAGKTTALAMLASQIANQDDSLGILSNSLPIFLHILDIDLPQAAIAAQDALEILLDAILLQNPGRSTASLRKHLKNAVTENRALFLLDGLDELNQKEHQRAAAYLNSLLEACPQLRVIATGAAHHIGGLVQMGFYPLALQAWGTEQLESFLEKWNTAWFAVSAGSPAAKAANPFLLKNWIKNTKMTLSPLEWTLLVWGTYAGDLHGLSPLHALEAYIGRFSTRSIPRLALESLAKELLTQGQTALLYSQANRFLSQFNPELERVEAIPAQSASAQETNSARRNHFATRKPGLKNQKVSSSERAISDLIESGVLAEHAQQRLSFTHPEIAGYLASFAVTSPEAEIPADEHWSLNRETLHFLAVQDKTALWHKRALAGEADLLFTDLLLTARWLRDTPAEMRWRTQTLKYLLGLLYNPAVPLPVRSRFLAAFAASNDPSVPTLFEKLLETGSPDVRVLAALGAGAIQDANAVPLLRNLFSDPDPTVRKAACLALGAIWTSPAALAISEALLSDDEALQFSAAEVLAHKPPEGHELLQEATSSKNLLARRAAVFGIAQIKQPWAHELLEKITIEDSQWVVRNAATQAVEAMDHSNPHIPRPLPVPSESPWLLAFAAKHGTGIGIDQTPLDLLLLALTSGLPDEKISALTYLRTIPRSEVILAITDLAQSSEGILQRAAIYALWYLSLTGI